MYRKIFEEMVEKILEKKITTEELINEIINNVDCEKIYDSEDLLLSDVYFSLKHYASGEEKIDDKEWVYLLECLKKEKKYSMLEKMSITTKPSSNE